MFISMRVTTSTIQVRLSESLCSESLSPLPASLFSLLKCRPKFPFRFFPHHLTVDFAPLTVGLLHDEAGSPNVVRFLDAEFEKLLLGQRCALRSEEHTSELQSRQYLVCRLLLEHK